MELSMYSPAGFGLLHAVQAFCSEVGELFRHTGVETPGFFVGDLERGRVAAAEVARMGGRRGEQRG